MPLTLIHHCLPFSLFAFFFSSMLFHLFAMPSNLKKEDRKLARVQEV